MANEAQEGVRILYLNQLEESAMARPTAQNDTQPRRPYKKETMMPIVEKIKRSYDVVLKAELDEIRDAEQEIGRARPLHDQARDEMRNAIMESHARSDNNEKKPEIGFSSNLIMHWQKSLT
ncbi:unnamed protein product [Cylicostephanus goldi]|uniref:Uncharacterized protein n=1 Tax=Cylicostephanus goldi TaxID=71465 RepID=A0A3P6UCJ1_CYLGO|nr:unnamed protein product [Cylicostephanus goldi]